MPQDPFYYWIIVPRGTPLGPAPVVLLCTPDVGSDLGGTPVTVTGTGFQNGATVGFNGDPATDVVWVSSTSITCTTPAGADGAANVLVTNPDAQDSGASGDGAFTYTTPPFSRASLNLNLWTKAGATFLHDDGAGNTRWIGTASAGNSGLNSLAKIGTIDSFVNGVILNGLQTARSNQTTAKISAIVQATDNGINGTLIFGATTGSMWILINPLNFTSGIQIFSCSGPSGGVIFGWGAFNGFVPSFGGVSFTSFVIPGTPGHWQLLSLDYDMTALLGQGQLRFRINKGAWATTSMNGTPPLLASPPQYGQDSSSSEFGDWAENAISPDKFSDVTWDNIYDDIKADYPDAALP